MNARQLKEKFVEFFVSKKHVEIPSSRIVPENDPTTLFISAGMQQLIPYFSGTPHPVGKRITDVQKCIRTGDIEDVGDSYHHTFFEMLGNWSLGDYFKNEMIPWSYEFLTKVLKINSTNLFVTCFAGNKNIPKDDLSASLWLSLGVSPDHIIFLEDNWWGPAGTTGPCGPDSEMFVDTHPQLPEVDFITGDKQGRYLEIWNDVFLNYNKTNSGTFEKLIQDNVDTGMGVERTTAILNGFDDNYLTTIWQPIIKKIEQLSGKNYSDQNYIKPIRIIADHIRSAVFIITDGVEPGNKEAGYVLRRLIRRSIRQGKILGIETNFVSQIAKAVLDNQDNYAGIYPELDQNKEKIFSVLDAEENKFRKTLDRGLNEINKLINTKHGVTSQEGFMLYESFGFPVELIQEELKKNNISFDIDGFEKCRLEHIKQSQTLSAGKFKSGLADNSEIITKYHTATHLLHTALRHVLGDHVQQSGSNITADRLRFDFSYDDKLTETQLKEITDIVNSKIKEKLVITKETIPFVEAQKQGAIAFFGNKYPEIVSVYTVGPKKNCYSKEVCTGPHVANTSELGIFEITKEESAGSGRRRIYAILK